MTGLFRVGNLDALGILVFVEFGAHRETSIACDRGNQLNDRAIAASRLAAPVDGDAREEAMGDFVPIAGAGRQMADRDRQLDRVR